MERLEAVGFGGGMTVRSRLRFVSMAVAALAATVPLSAAGGAGEGPPVESDPVALETSLDCPDGLVHAGRPVVLLVHGTATTDTESWPTGLGTVLAGAGFDWCMVQLPGRALVDIQRSAEHVVDAVRRLHRLTGRQVSLVGHSQGALQPRWAVRWWPDVRRAVDDIVTIAGANREIPWTEAAFCANGCPASIWQFSQGAAFMAALNRAPTPAGPSYTTVRSHTDNLIQPSLPAETAVATIDGASNVAVQDLCPGRVVEHVGLIFDATALAVTLDALSHPGPADPARVGTGSCAQVYAPGIDNGVATTAIATLYANAFPAIAAAEKVSAEPPLRPFAREG